MKIYGYSRKDFYSLMLLPLVTLGLGSIKELLDMESSRLILLQDMVSDKETQEMLLRGRS